MKQNEFCPEVIGGRDGIWQGMQRSSTEVHGEQEGPNCSSALNRVLLKGTRTNSKNKAIGATKHLFRH